MALKPGTTAEMNFGRAFSMGGIVAGIAAVLNMLRAQGLITTQGLIYGLVVFGAIVCAYAVSFGYTQFYKNAWVPDLTTLDKPTERLWRQRIYLRAVLSAFLTICLEGIVLILLGVSRQQMIVYAVFWFLGSLAIGLSSPWIWKVIFEMLLPWLRGEIRAASQPQPPAGGG